MDYKSLIELLAYRVERQPQKVVFTFLNVKGKARTALTACQLAEQAAAVAQLLLYKAKINKGDRVILAYPPDSIHFISAFWGCLLAGAVAVPLPPPHPKKLNIDLIQFNEIVKSCGSKILLTNTSYKHFSRMAIGVTNLVNFTVNKQKIDWPELQWFTTDKLQPVTDYKKYLNSSDINPTSLAYLQYTSGSTSQPKGVMLTHSNVLANLAHIHHELKQTEQSIFIGWVPLFYDMGLVAGMLNTIYSGSTLYLLSPLDFLQNPKIFLEAIDKYQITDTSFPNFGYEYCSQRINSDEIKSVRLNTWKVAVQGGEAARPHTLKQFAEKFKPNHFFMDALCNVYGLAEAVVYISGGVNYPINFLSVDKNEIEKNQRVKLSEQNDKSRSITSVGIPNAAMGIRVIIVNPNTLTTCKAEEVGEIWVSSPSIALGYWGLSIEENTAIFRARPIDEPAESALTYLRTGDMGFFYEQELFICGRLKEMLIISGRNLYSQDIEQTIALNCCQVNSTAIAAFAIERNNQEQLVIVAELTEKSLTDTKLQEEIAANIRTAIVVAHAVVCYAIALIKPDSISRTRTGKVQRFHCRQAYIDKKLQTIFYSELDGDGLEKLAALNQYQDGSAIQKSDIAADGESNDVIHIAAEIQQFMSSVLKIDANKINIDESLLKIGIESLQMAMLKQFIDKHWNIDISFEYLAQGPSALQLAELIKQQLPIKYQQTNERTIEEFEI